MIALTMIKNLDNNIFIVVLESVDSLELDLERTENCNKIGTEFEG